MGFPFWFLKRVHRRPVAPPLTAPLPRSLPGTPSPFLRDGRRHLDVPYLLPKDTTELERLDYQHHALTALLGGLTLATLPMKLSSVLDVGCGTGRWAYEMARAFPHCQVVGLDLEPAPRRGQQVPPIICSSRAMSSPAYPLKVTALPLSISACSCSLFPVMPGPRSLLISYGCSVPAG